MKSSGCILISLFLWVPIFSMAQDHLPCDSHGEFVPGEVDVFLNKTNTPSRAIAAFSRKYQLKWKGGKPRISFVPAFRAYVAISKDTRQTRKELMEAISKKAHELFGDDYLTNVSLVFVEAYGGPVIVVGFGPNSKHLDAEKIVSSLDGLILKGIIDDSSPLAGIVLSIHGVVLVPEGEEQKWVDTFNQDALNKDSIIVSAHLIRILHLN